jgi:RNA polymerase sigma factor (TIGR02999 family)
MTTSSSWNAGPAGEQPDGPALVLCRSSHDTAGPALARSASVRHNPGLAARPATMNEDPNDISGLITKMKHGDRAAKDRLWSLVYPSLHSIAERQMRHDRLDQTLQPGALVNEGYLKLSEESGTRWKGRAHFFATAASVMRHILVDRARARGAGKRGGRSRRVTLEAAEASVAERPAVDVLALEEALCELARSEPRQARVVELRYFADMSVEDTAEALHVSPRTVKSDWSAARVWLRRRLREA